MRAKTLLVGALGVAAVLAGTCSLLACTPDANAQAGWLGAADRLARAQSRWNYEHGKHPADRLPDGRLRALRVRLAWNRPADVDLHVTEPNGIKCWYRRRTTASGGWLNTDDTSRQGPEVYTSGVPPTRGTYRIGVCYFRGTGPVLATVAVYPPARAPRTYRVRLTRADRNRVTPVATVRVP